MYISHIKEIVNMRIAEDFYVGLDIGTDSVGYAVTDQSYKLLKFKGEPLWGVTIFDAAKQSAERRSFRTARRRIKRTQQRVALVGEIFAKEIGDVDPRFFIRRMESALYRDDVSPQDPYPVFSDEKYTDVNFYGEHPTIHHLLTELMTDCKPHDIRLVYIACAWLVAHRGHFLSEVDRDNVENVCDFNAVYDELMDHFTQNGMNKPWQCGALDFAGVMQQKEGVTQKEKDFYNLLFNGKKPKDDGQEACMCSRSRLIKLLCGGKVTADNLFCTDAYSDVPSFSLGMGDDELSVVLRELGDDAELVVRAKAVFDWAALVDVLAGKSTISEAKVFVYEQHKRDLKALKAFIRKYRADRYSEVFRVAGKDKKNYAAYSHNFKSVNLKDLKDSKLPSASKEDFSKYLISVVKGIKCDECDQPFYEDMMSRLELRSFLPKQVETDNRVIPYQLYWHELCQVLRNAEVYLPFLSERDEDGLTASDKIKSIFTFRVPYYVGPLNRQSEHAWLERKAEKIYPWNFDEVVDADMSEQAFIRRMTNTCTYLPDQPVLAKNSILNCRFNVLNEINNLKIDDVPISVNAKQGIYHDLFEKRARVTPKMIRQYCLSNGYMQEGQTLGGIDIAIKSTLRPQLDFAYLLNAGTLSEQDAERIIERITYSEDWMRLSRWLSREYPVLSEDDVRRISRQKYNDFGRLSRALLDGLEGMCERTGECGTIIHFLWDTNCNLMQLLSSDYTFTALIEQAKAEYYRSKPKNLSERLDDLYISNAVKRPIIRAMEIIKELTKALGAKPAKIFVEMARDAGDDKKGKRTQTRLNQLKELYKRIDSDDTRLLDAQLNEMGGDADNRLQSEALFLYYLQLGRCMYTGKPIQVDRLKENLYNIEHIYPQSYVKDDSILNNKVLVFSDINGQKSNQYPIDSNIRQNMRSYWDMLHKNGLINDEKHMRLTRGTSFTSDEKLGFINRQLVETRQTTKVVAMLLKEMYPEPDTKVVYVKAGLVSDFRHEFDMVKSRGVNDLHHAKDAYLNIVVGNVYYERFSKRWFSIDSEYSIKTKTIFGRPVRCGENIVWNGASSLNMIRSSLQKNNIHLTQYAFMRKGGLFDQMPQRRQEGLVPRKAGLDTEKYGGYAKPTATFYIVVRYICKQKRDVMLMPVELMFADRFLQDEGYARRYVQDTVSKILNKPISNIDFPLGMRPLKINTVLSFDGFLTCLSGKSSGGRYILLSHIIPLTVGTQWERYIKRIESFEEKRKKNSNIVANSKYDMITSKQNVELYDLFSDKIQNRPYNIMFGGLTQCLIDGREKFIGLPVEQQTSCLLQILLLFKTCRAGSCDLRAVGGSANTGIQYVSATLSNWQRYQKVCIVDASPAGLFMKTSVNLLELL